MASVPFATYSAARVHQHLKKHSQNEEQEKEDTPTVSDVFLPCPKLWVDPVLPNYNGKLMNSIWGMYNLYAAHAFQKNSEGGLAGATVAAPQAKTWSLWEFMRPLN